MIPIAVLGRFAHVARLTPLLGVLCLSCANEDSPDVPPMDSPAANETSPPATNDSIASVDTTPDAGRTAGDSTAASIGRGSAASGGSGAATGTAADSASIEQAAALTGQDGEAILRRASSAYERVRSMKASFTMAVENPLLRTTTNSRGTLYQMSPDRIKLEFTEPAGDVIVGDGTYFWIYYPSVDATQVIRVPAAQAGASGSVDLRAQFVGDPVDRFEFTLHGTETVDSRTTSVLTLVPKQDMDYRQLKVWIDTADGLARKFDVVEHGGITRRVQLFSLEINRPLGDALFRFTPPPGARIIER
jgi:outer membrane lipoprotein carrier protein